MKATPYRLAAVFVALLHGLSALAAETSLADIPIAVQNTVKPNVMFTLDDSGSMQFEVIPESSDVYFVYPRPATVYGTGWGYGSTYAECANFDANNKYARYFRTAAYNKLYYDPTIRYLPWSDANGTLMADAAVTAAPHNPDAPTTEGTRDLTSAHNMTCDFRGDGLGSTTISAYPATYFVYTGPTALTGVNDANNLVTNFTQVQISSGTTSYTIANAPKRDDCTLSDSPPKPTSTATCPYAKEIQNFANWYTYYRSRILAARAGVGRAFAKQGPGMRLGFAAINQGSTAVDGTNTTTVVTGVRDFTGTDRTAWFAKLYGHAMPSQGTPLRRALNDVGQYYSRTDDAGPWGQTPGSTGGTQYACRKNYNILMTDGYWNTGAGAAGTAGARLNVDNTAGSSLSTDTPLPPNMSVAQTYQYSPGNPYSDSHADTLADVAMYYWVNDLRSGTTTGLANRVPPSSRDPAFWQHMSTFTVGFGVTGSVSQADIDSAFTTSPNTITWPNPTSGDPAKADDLAHAAINGHGAFYSASDPDTFATSLNAVLTEINSQGGAAAAVAVANANITGSDNASYASSYDATTWIGDLLGYPIDTSTAAVDINSPIWTTGCANPAALVDPANPSRGVLGCSAQTQLETLTSATRHIVSYNGSTGIQFQPTTNSTAATKLSSAQEALLNTPGQSDGATVIEFLRGDRSKEAASTLPSYRVRTKLLGDIVNAEPVIVREPRANYFDTGYAAFKALHTPDPNASPVVPGRTKVIVQGANDGMVHIFRGAPSTEDANGGKEEWAYVPNLLINMRDPNNSSTSVLNILSRKSGFEHKFHVDATPVQGDVDFSNTNGITGNPAADWRTIVVGGLGKGGRGIYALDLTNPTLSGNDDNAKEANAKSKVLWEFPNGATSSTITNNTGFVFGRPIITKTAKGWVVLVASGYNNGSGTNSSGGDGHGYLFVLNARTGEVIKAIDTGAGSTTEPAGLAHLAGYATNHDYDNTATEAYGGDLLGNVWRFNLTGNNTNSWTAVRLAILKDPSGNTQPVTTEPELASIQINGVFQRFVYVGTGKYLDSGDVGTTQVQTMYGLIDDMTNSPEITSPIRNQLQVQTLTTAGLSRTASNTAVDFTTKKGWYVDLPASKERINTIPALALGALVFTSNIPTSDPCLPGGSSWFNVLDYKTGGFLTQSTVTWSSVFLGDVLASRPVVIKLPSGLVKALVRKSDATTVAITVPVPPTSSTGRRVSWRELTN